MRHGCWSVILVVLAVQPLSPREVHAEAGMVLVDATSDTGGCAVNSNCPCGYFCVSGRCRWNPSPPPSCASERDCQTSCSGLLCIGGSCVAPDGGTATDVGVDGPTDVDIPTIDVPAVIDVFVQRDTGSVDIGPRSQDAPVDTGAIAVDPENKGGGCTVRPTASPRPGLLALLAIVGAALVRGLRPAPRPALDPSRSLPRRSP